MPIILGLLLIIIVFIRFSKSREKNPNKKKVEDFLQRERDSQFVPRKDISALDYISIPYGSLPFRYWMPGGNAPIRISSGTSPETRLPSVSSDYTDSSRELSFQPVHDTDTPESGSFTESSPYLRPAEYSAPLSEELASVEYTLCQLSEKKILNLTGISNTELRFSYGTANLDILTAYDQNFTELIRSLQKWGTLLTSSGQKKDAITVLSYAVSIGSDVAGTYTLLGKLYKEFGDLDKIEELKTSAEQLSTLMKPSILRDLTMLASPLKDDIDSILSEEER